MIVEYDLEAQSICSLHNLVSDGDQITHKTSARETLNSTKNHNCISVGVEVLSKAAYPQSLCSSIVFVETFDF